MCQDDLFPCFDEWVSPSVISRLRGDIRLQYDRSRVRFPQLGRAGIGSRDGRCCVGHVTVDAYQSSWQVPRAQGRAWLAGLPSWPLRVGGGQGQAAGPGGGNIPALLPHARGPGLHGLLCRGCDESEDGSHCAGGVQAGGHPFRREAASDDQIRSCDTDRCHLLSQAQARCEASMRLKFTGGQPGARHLVPSFPLVCGQGTATAWVSGSGPATPNS